MSRIEYVICSSPEFLVLALSQHRPNVLRPCWRGEAQRYMEAILPPTARQGKIDEGWGDSSNDLARVSPLGRDYDKTIQAQAEQASPREAIYMGPSL
ncbi:hypothetical protein N7510_004623 [Penicillium lagena]|uniref:uncharacterized protein n=1 Tax=Penicillium lagena TaxID=94218 RepID=UPI00254144E1|nr:uncharacterized protein N7510_004623 [Penicillium lagena]KAJ5620639.1 hypothetical protein N7510_004623 [Penicillium lagena]